MALRPLLGKLGYGTLFTVILPAALALLAFRLDNSGMSFWPLAPPAAAGLIGLLVGATLMAVSMLALWQIGQGLPMNAYPTIRFVGSSTYALFSHPIYVGFVLLVASVSLMLHSPAGFWLVTPIAALAAMALVFGYEGPMLRERFGAPSEAPLFGLPLQNHDRASVLRRCAAGVTALLPWACAYVLFSALVAPAGAVELRFDWESTLPRPAWAAWMYSLAYPMTFGAVLTIRTNALLRRFVVSAWLATFTGFFLMLVLPGRADLLPGDFSGVTARLMQGNRLFDSHWLAFPSFHVIWSILSARLLAERFPGSRLLWAGLALGIALSCVLTGSHALIDVLAGAGLAVLVWRHRLVWQLLLGLVEQASNSWSARQWGPVRAISHAAWSFASAVAGTLVVLFLAGPQALVPSAFVILTGLLSAGAWGYWLEGGNRLSRPFGYYGFLFGTMAAVLALFLGGHRHAGALAAALAAAGAIAQAIGRVRCMVQGCCHGRPVFRGPGIQVTNRFSRVTSLSGLSHVPLHPTQLYSMVANSLLAIVLLRLWATGAPWTVVVGMYLVLSSLSRFVEEQYRGEPQTAKWKGLAIYQWLAISLFVVGLATMALHSVPVSPHYWLGSTGMTLSVAVGLMAALFMSVDFPGSSRRFSRLTVTADK
ncbi:MAG: prolipoprotein diacylglyceryl transferase family protein [Ramlibacter sp.]